MFCFGEYLVYKGSNTYHINSVEPIEIFYNIRTDLDKLKYAVHINKILQLLLNTLYIISETDKDLDFVLGVFKLRLLCILGFRPRVNECTQCKQKEKLQYFSIKDDGLKCEICGKQDKSAITMSEGTKNAIIYTITAPAKKLYSFNIKDEALEEFKLITKLYFNQKLEKEYKLEELF